jgi:hypothetical protein
MIWFINQPCIGTVKETFEAGEQIQEHTMQCVMQMGLQFGIEVSSLDITDIDSESESKIP